MTLCVDTSGSMITVLDEVPLHNFHQFHHMLIIIYMCFKNGSQYTLHHKCVHHKHHTQLHTTSHTSHNHTQPHKHHTLHITSHNLTQPHTTSHNLTQPHTTSQTPHTAHNLTQLHTTSHTSHNHTQPYTTSHNLTQPHTTSQIILTQVKRELTALVWTVLKPNNIQFNIIQFASKITQFKPSVQYPTEEVCVQAAEFIGNLLAGGKQFSNITVHNFII